MLNSFVQIVRANPWTAIGCAVAAWLLLALLLSQFHRRLFATSLRSLDSHFLRSLLATLGVLIGVASVEQLKANVRAVREAVPMTLAERRELEAAMG